MSFTVLDEDEALDEAEEYEATVKPPTTLISTEAFPDSTVKTGTFDVEQILAAVWVEETAPQFHGVWWQDDYDPDRLSAPRGVIAANKIAAWISAAKPRDTERSE